MANFLTVENSLSASGPPGRTGSLKKSPSANIFVNPIAGGGKCSKKYRTVVHKLREAGVVCNVMTSQYPGHITRVASELAARGHKTFIACGGDGTVNELINGIAGTETAMGIVPLGTGNDFATNMGISKDINLACAIIKERRVKEIDLVRVNDDRFFAGVGCLGFDAEVAAFAGRKRKDGSNPFLLHIMGGILKFVSYKPKTVELRFDGHRYFGDIFLVAFGNTRTYARGMMITPQAVSDDASLDICVVRKMPRWKILSIFPSVYKGAHLNSEEITLHRAGAVYVQSMKPMDLYADGDFMTTTPFRLEVVPKYLKVIVAPSSS
ncbi:MAG: diacylglycerol kinase family lipid kinase [Desulfobacterales bacterium]|nr:diacylglycerol kinase family lipid kinase [Desulfobacterales bacterium]